MDGVLEAIAVGEHGLVLRRWRVADAPRLLTAIESSLPELRLFMPWAMQNPSLEIEEFLQSVASGGSTGFGLLEDDGDGEWWAASASTTGGGPASWRSVTGCAATGPGGATPPPPPAP